MGPLSWYDVHLLEYSTSIDRGSILMACLMINSLDTIHAVSVLSVRKMR